MTRVFVAGPIDFQDPSDVADYRLDLREELRERGFTPVDQYSDALELLESIDGGIEEVAERVDELPDEPYVRAVQYAVAATSLSEVLSNPELVPLHTPSSVTADLVERDLELVETTDAVLAYLPTPSCGTMAEIVHASDRDLPVVVHSETPPHFVQYYANRVERDSEDALDALGEMLD